jgi:hypothetical protein
MGFFDNLKQFAGGILNSLKGAYDWATGSSPIAQGIKTGANYLANSGIPILSTIAKGYGALTSPQVGGALSSAQQALATNNPLQAGQALYSGAKGALQTFRQ